MLSAVSRMMTLVQIQMQHGGRASEKGTLSKNKVFLVYGHDKAAKNEVSIFLREVGIQPIDISELASSGRTIITQIEEYSQVPFAIVLLTPDDYGYARRRGRRARMLRARQNVIFEFGFFRGLLGGARVCPLRKGKIELPSDIDGVIYKPMETNGAWKIGLVQELQASGLKVNLKKFLGEK